MVYSREGRITDENIVQLKDGEVFVFGSNESGIHGAGAAKEAKNKFGAIEGKGWGPSGDSFAIATKGWDLSVIPLKAIECYVGRFVGYALLNPKKRFLVTQIGCGLAGYKPDDIAPLFAGVDVVENISLPQCFWDVIDKVYKEDIIKYMLIEDDDGQKNEL